jgi:hypothetical protein
MSMSDEASDTPITDQAADEAKWAVYNAQVYDGTWIGKMAALERALSAANAAHAAAEKTWNEDAAKHVEYHNALCAERDTALCELEEAKAVIRNFAKPENWHLEVGCLQWLGKRNALEYAQSVLAALSPKGGD